MSEPNPSAPTRRGVLAAALLLSVVLAVAVGEVVLRLALAPADFLAPDLRDDPKLGLMIKPFDRGHDAHGFRNPEVPKQVDIVAVGDSFTYGYNATRGGSWPGQLERILGRPIYNAGLGGFGPLHHLYVTENFVPPLKPKLQIVAIYAGNDIMDVYNLTQLRPHWFSWRQSQRVEGAKTELDVQGQQDYEETQSRRFLGPLRDWLAGNSMVYSVIRATVLTPMAAAMSARRTLPLTTEIHMPWQDPRHPAVTTIFSSRFRLMSMDAAIPEVEEGFQITDRAFAALKQSVDKQGHQLLMVMIPTKERVYCKALKATSTPLPDTHTKLCEVESRLTERVVTMAQRHGIRIVDVTGDMEQAAERGDVLFQRNEDGHPVAAGYGVIAQSIAKALASP